MADINKYDRWNARPRMTPDEFAKWQQDWHDREIKEMYGLQCVTRKIIGQIHDELIIDADERTLGSDFDKWFLGQLHISTEGL
jgi:hypothetical protein